MKPNAIERQELADAAWVILKDHGVVADIPSSQLAMKLADRVAGMRDRQRDRA